MKSKAQAARLSGCLVLFIAAAEVIIMSTPFAALFYSSLGFKGFQGFLSEHAATAWLTSFFLPSSAVTTSALLEWHRELGSLLVKLGMWGFLISAAQVYSNKLFKRGVATGLLYRISRHPQYLSLAVAGYGMVVVWPRLLFLGLWVTMLFLYAWLARFEEKRMAERFGDDYIDFKESRAYFLPGSPVRRLFEATLGKMRPVALGWISAYVVCLLIAFGLALPLRQYTIAHLTLYEVPGQNALAVSVWPTDEETMRRTVDPVLRKLQREVERDNDLPLFLTVMPTDYNQKASYYLLDPRRGRFSRVEGLSWETMGKLVRAFLIPTRGYRWGEMPLMGHPPEEGQKVHVVIAEAEKAYRDGLSLDEVMDLGVRTIPLAITNARPNNGAVGPIQQTMRQNVWGAEVVMPVF